MAAASGVLFGPLVGVNQPWGSDLILKAFIVVVVGGMGNLGGSILASIFISMLEAFAVAGVSPAQAVIVSFVVLILTLLFGPRACSCRHRNDATVTQRVLVPVGYWIGFGVVLGAPRRRAPRAARVLAALRDGDLDLGPAGDVAPTS